MLRIFLFGATGDLSIKKLFPALFELLHANKMPETHEIVCIGRRDYSQEDFQNFIAEQVGGVRDVQKWFSFIKNLRYEQVVFEEAMNYELLRAKIQPEVGDTHLFYLATAPQYFEVIVSHLASSQLLVKGNHLHRIVIEKPFGTDLESAHKINRHLDQFLEEDQIYRMDHYLGKEMIQNIMMLRFNNVLFEAGWHKDYIDHVQITVAESYGVFERAGYYDQSGAVRDMIQSHLLQMVALIAMEPSCLDDQELCKAKMEVLKHLAFENVHKDIVLGQYVRNGDVKGYIEEAGVDPNSLTETYAAIKIRINVPRWEGVDFYLRTGKQLAKKASEIVIVYKQPTHQIGQDVPPNTLSIQIHPQEGMTVKFNMKKPGSVKELITREMAFCQSCLLDYDAPEAYETLIHEVILGKHDLYTRWDEVRYAWTFVEAILSRCHKDDVVINQYPAGSRGPSEADALLERSGRSWYTL